MTNLSEGIDRSDRFVIRGFVIRHSAHAALERKNAALAGF